MTTMTRCDRCGKAQHQGGTRLHLTDDGYEHLFGPGGGATFGYADKDFCSLACLAAWAAQEVERERERQESLERRIEAARERREEAVAVPDGPAGWLRWWPRRA